MTLNLWEIAQLIFCIYVVLKLIAINHNQSIITNNQSKLVENHKILDKKLDTLLGKDKSILDNIFKETK